MGNTSTAPKKSPAKERVTFSASTLKRRKAQRLQREHAYRYALLMKYDKSQTGALSRDEVKDLAKSLLREYTPLVGGLTEDDVDLIMRIGGETCEKEITSEQLPAALAVVDSIRASNEEFLELFRKHDVDKTGTLPLDQLESLLAEMNGGHPPEQEDVDYIVNQVSSKSSSSSSAKENVRTSGLSAAELKAALYSWYCCVDDN